MPSDDLEIISVYDSSDDDTPLRPSRFKNQDLEEYLESDEDVNDSDDDDDEPRSSLHTSRRQVRLQEDLEQESESESDLETTWLNAPPIPNLGARKSFQKILTTMEDLDDLHLLYPKSLHPDFCYDDTLADERRTLLELVPLETLSIASDSDFEEVDLNNFSVYRGFSGSRGVHGQFDYLHVVSSEKNSETFYLDGTISCDQGSHHIVGALIDDVNIGGLDDNKCHTSKGQIWIRTKEGKFRGDCWYRLVTPAAEYFQYFNKFLWLADLNKHVIDYLCDASDKGVDIRFQHFESDFINTLSNWHGGNEMFESWRQRPNCNDFRHHITTHASFLRDQSWSISEQPDFNKQIRSHPIWDQLAAGILTLEQRSVSKEEQTVVTPSIGRIFNRSFPAWDRFDLLKPIAMNEKVAASLEAHRQDSRFPKKLCEGKNASKSTLDAALILERAALGKERVPLNINELSGKVVAVRSSEVGSKFRKKQQQSFRFALVKEVIRSGRALRVIWLTLPNATLYGHQSQRTYYPVKNELFFSDDCNCEPVPLRNIVGIYDACNLNSHQYTPKKFVLQLLYREDEETFTTPTESELLCSCRLGIKKNQKYKPSQPESSDALKKIRNMSLFSGAGLLDYGMEASDFFETVYAIDHSETAIQSHTVNNKNEDCKYVVGSVNGQLEQFLRGNQHPPDIDCITAGCSCTGYSLLNRHRHKINGQRQCSLLASTLSWVELFRPKFVLIENVPQMDHIPTKPDRANAAAQAVCCLVAMGYQVRKMVLNASKYGAPTTRRRLFLVAAAPNMVLPDEARITHGESAPLKPIVTVNDAIGDLDPLHNDAVMNIQHPSHVPVQRLSSWIDDKINLRNLVKRISPGEGLVRASQKGLLSVKQRIWLSERSEEQQGSSSMALTRINGKKPFRTLVTSIAPLDARFGGMIVHPTQDRLISLQEFRRGQGLPDSFLLVGTLTQQIEQIGNGVPWQLGAAHGQAIGEAWVKSHNRLLRENHQSTETATPSLEENIDADSEKRCSEDMLSHRKLAEDLSYIYISDDDSIDLTAPKARILSSTPETDQNPRETFSLRQFKHQKTSPPSTSSTERIGQSPFEAAYETSDRESLIIKPDGTMRYQRDHHKRISMTDTSNRNKPNVMVEVPQRKMTNQYFSPRTSTLPVRTKRYASLRNESDDESDVVFVEERAVAKKPRRS